jgi:O-antigen/teichoic acid export membrane protein
MGATAKVAPEEESITGEIATAVRHTFVYGFASILAKVVGFLLLPLYTHFLSPRDYGVFEVLELTMSLLGMFLNMGITSALLRYYGSADTEEQKRKVVGSLFLFTLATAAVVFVAGFSGARPVTTLLVGPGVPAIYLFLSFVGFLIAYVANVPDTALRAKEMSGTVATIDTLSTIGLLLLNVYLVSTLKNSLFGMFLGRVIINIINIAVLIRYARRELFAGMDWKLLRGAIGFGAPLILSNLTMFVLNFSDRFFLQRLQSLEIVGVYAVGYKFGYLLSTVVSWPFFMMWHARMYAVYKRPDHEKIFARILVLYSAVLILAGLGICVFNTEVMKLMVDARYAAGAAVIPVVTLSYVVLGVGTFVQVGLYLESRTGLLGMISIAAAIVNLGANYFLIKQFGMIGAAWATVIGFLAIAVGSYYCSQRVCPISLPIGRVARALAVATGIYLLSRVLPAQSLAVALLLKSILMLGFPFLLWLSGCLSSDEIATLHSLWADATRLIRRPLRPARVKEVQA